MKQTAAKIQTLYLVLPDKSDASGILFFSKKGMLWEGRKRKPDMDDEIIRLNALARQPPFCFIHKADHAFIL